MKCPFCGYVFREEEGKATCQGCPLAKRCSKIRCPNCSYEMAKTPGIIKALRALRRQDERNRREK